MLPMQGLTDQGPPHEIPPEAAADYSHTGWEGGFERGGPEVYTYTAGEDYDMLVIRIDEVFYDEPNDDFPDDELDEESPEDQRERWEVDKRYSTWRGECRLYGDPRDEEIYELLQLGQSVRTDPDDRRREANVSFIYSEVAIESPDDVILELLLRVPEAWLQAALTWRGAIWHGWTQSYQNVAGKVLAPTWI